MVKVDARVQPDPGLRPGPKKLAHRLGAAEKALEKGFEVALTGKSRKALGNFFDANARACEVVGDILADPLTPERARFLVGAAQLLSGAAMGVEKVLSQLEESPGKSEGNKKLVQRLGQVEDKLEKGFELALAGKSRKSLRSFLEASEQAQAVIRELVSHPITPERAHLLEGASQLLSNVAAGMRKVVGELGKSPEKPVRDTFEG